MQSDTWRFLAELVRQLDDGIEASGHTVGDALGLDEDTCARQIQALRRRAFVEIRPGPRRLSDGPLAAKLEVTPNGIHASTSGRID